MKMSLQKVFSFVLALIMVFGLIPVTTLADEVQTASAEALPTSMEGLSIAYPYNTETVQQTGTPASRFQALTFESARNEVESAQMILSPNFDITSFELTMGSLKNEKGNIIPSWAFEVYIQHYVTVSGSGNAPYWSDTFQMYNPTYSKNGYDGTYPDALIPQDAAITAGENKISAGKNGGIWVNLNVQGAAPGTYTGIATLTVNGTDMEIPVSVKIYDVTLPDQVHAKSSVGIWWDMVENGEGYIDRNLADTYFDYLVSKRIMPYDAWSLTRWDEPFAEYVATYLAVSPEISSYGLYYAKNSQGSLDVDTLRTTLTTLINKNITLAQSGSNVDLFAKAYLYFGSICDEPRDDAEYKAVNNITAQLDSLKAELAPMLDAYPSLQASFMSLKHLVTGPNPTDKTYADKTTGSFWNKETFIDDDYGSTPLSGDSYVYVPQYQWLHTDAQRALYENEDQLWWYGCCHPITPYPTYHINNPLVSARVESWMRYDYGIDGFVYSSVNIWGDYTNSGIQEFDYWNSYVNNGTPGDQILVLPGSDYGLYGPIGTIRIENIREGNEDYEYLWMLENEYGISDISAYTANLYSGVIPDTDASIHYNSRKALLTKLEQLSVAQNGATQIAPGNEGFVRGQEIKPSTSLTIELGNTEELATLSFDYKVTSGTFNISLNPDWDSYYGYFAFNANGKVDNYDGVTVEKLDDGYFRVTFKLGALTKKSGTPAKTLSFLYLRGAWTDAQGYIDNVTFTLPGENEPGSGRVLIAGDVHVSADDAHTRDQLKKTLTYAKNNGVDLMIFNGDTVNVGDEADYAALDSVFTEVFGSPEQVTMKFIFNMGNHEFYPTGACAHEETDYALQFNRFAAFASKWSDFTAEQGSIYLTEVNGISYVVAAPSDKWTYMEGGKLVYCAALGGYHEDDIALIDSLIAQATENNPGEPVYLLSHHPWGETYGGASYGMPETKVVTAMRAVMEKYPHLVNVTSHTHFSSLHERSLAQDKWTTINTGMHTYGKYVDIETDVNGDQLDYVNIESRRYTGTDAEGKALHGTTHLVWDVNYGEESFTAAVFNMATESAYSYLNYTIPYGITAENKSEKFAYELSERTAPILTWSAEDVLTVELVQNGSANALNLAFNDTEQFYETEGYRIRVVNASTGETLKTVLWASRFWAAQEKKDSYEITVDGLPRCSEYTITVEAIDFYGNYSAAKLEATVQYSGAVQTETALLLQKCNGSNANCSARDYSNIYFATAPFTSVNDTLTLVVKTDCTSITLRGLSDVSGTWEGSAVSKNLEDLGDGWKTATWTLSEILKGNDAATMNGFKITGLVEGMDILMKDILINNQTDWVGDYRDNYHGVITQQQIEVAEEEEVNRGQQIVSRTDLTIEFGNAEELATLSFDYKLSSGTFNISLNPDWDNAFGYFAFDANGNVDPYDGVTLETLEDGYTRVTFDLNALTKYTGSPSKVLTFLYLRGAWSDATGYIDNVQFTVAGQPEEPAYRGQEINPSTSLTIELGNTEELSTLSFDYKVLSGTFNISLNPDWDNAFGYFAFDANGNVDAYDGVTVETLEDGYYRVTFDLNALTKYSGNPAKTLSFLYIRGAWTDATGYIDNVQYTVYEAPSEPETNRGQEITPSTSLTIELGNTEELSTLSFDYKVLSGTFNISLNPDWDNAFGYFAFNENGNVDPYDGVTLETLADGYTRVTFDMNALTKYSGNPGKALSFLYIRGAWTDATGYIDNIQYTVAENPVEPENRGQEFSANTDLTIDLATTGVLGTLSFDYKITSGEAFNIALMPNWDSYFGYFAFTAEGSVDPYNGVTTEVLEDGYIRVTFDMDALTKVSGTPSKFIDFIYIRGGWTTANGYIDNIQWTVGCDHNYETVSKEPTFTEAGGNVHTCSKCGNSYVTEEIPAYTFQVIQWNIALADDIRANFYLDIDSRLEDAFVTVLVDGYGYKYALSELATTDKGYYIVSANAAAAQMTDNISLAVSSGDLSSEEKTYTIRQYAEYILTGNYEDNTKLLVQRMLNYGAAAQSYFAYHTDNMANAGYEMTDAPTIPEVDGGSVASGNVSGISYYGASLLYTTKVGVRFYYTVTGNIESYTFTDAKGNTYEPVAKSGLYYVEVMNINPDQYDDVIEMLVSDGSNALSVSYSPMRYISRKFHGSDNADLVNLVARMYQYHKAAETYLGGAESVDVSYSFTGNEANRAGYAEGVVTISNAKAGETYELYWANSTGKLTGYRALGSATLAEGQSNVSFAIAENVMIPAGADRLIVCASGSEEASGTYSLGEKVSAAQMESKFAVISDVHTNYTQGEQYLLSALKRFEAEGVSYVIITGDIGESDSDYAKYVSAVEKSNFSGLIFASIGNHDQTDTGRKNFKTYAIYDGTAKTWVGIDNAPAYFAGSYAGSLNVAVELAGENLAYYVVTIGENAYIFMDQELTSTGNTPSQDNFSKEQLNFVEDKLYQYSATHNLFIIEHAPIEQLKIGDKFDPGYGGAIQLSAAYPNNQRFVELLMEYTEAIWLSGHTHVQYDTGIMYVDKYYDASENLTDTAIAHAVHVSSLAQPRWYEGSSMKMPNDYSAASQGYVCYQYADDIVFEARVFKNYTPDSINLDTSLFVNETESIYSWAIPLENMTHDAPSYDEEEGGEEVTLIDYAVAENGYKRAGSPTWEDTDDGLKVTFAAASDRFEIKTGDQTEAFTNGYLVQFKIKTDLTSFDLGGSNYSGGRKTYIQVSLAASGDLYTVSDLGDGWKLVTIPMSNLGHSSIITEFAIRFYNTNAAGTFYLKELYIAPEMEEEVYTDYAIAENGNKRAGSPTWEDTDDGLKVTFAAKSDRFEIKTGDQTEAFTNGYIVQFKIKTDLTSFDLGGSNYSGSRKTYIQVNLSASGDQYTVTDLGDGWKLVTIPMSNLGHSSIITEFAIRFYNTNASGTFYLKDLNIIPAK